MPALARALKVRSVTDTLHSELGRLCRAITATTDLAHPQLGEAVAELLSHIGVYRSDYRNLSSVLPTALGETVSARPDLAQPLAIVSAAVAAGDEPAVRLQQLCGAAMAKSTEDCLFYRDPRLVSLNEVGGEPELFGVSLAEFHQRGAARARLWPTAMTALSTHDTKRGEDVRARIGVLSQVPSLWAEFVSGWEQLAPSPDAPTGLFLWQNIFGVWPVDGVVTDELRARMHAYAEKAIREAAVHTTWNDPDTEFEAKVHEWINELIDGSVSARLTSLVGQLDEHAHSDSLGQKLIQLTAPGVPDIYQGTELWDDSLVDPDNRRPVDFAVRRDALTSLTHPKIRVVAAALALRRQLPATFTEGGYTPVLADGSAAEHVAAFARGSEVVTAVTRYSAKLSESGWGDTHLTLPTGTWKDRIGGGTFSGSASAGRVGLAESRPSPSWSEQSMGLNLAVLGATAAEGGRTRPRTAR